MTSSSLFTLKTEDADLLSLVESLAREELEEVLLLVALQLNNLTSVLVIDDNPAATPPLLELLDHARQIQLGVEAANRGDALAAVTLLNVDFDHPLRGRTGASAGASCCCIKSRHAVH